MLNQAQDHSGHQALCNCIGCIPMQLALLLRQVDPNKREAQGLFKEHTQTPNQRKFLHSPQQNLNGKGISHHPGTILEKMVKVIHMHTTLCTLSRASQTPWLAQGAIAKYHRWMV